MDLDFFDDTRLVDDPDEMWEPDEISGYGEKDDFDEKGDFDEAESSADDDKIDDDWEEESDDWSQGESHPDERPAEGDRANFVKVALDWVELEGALENNSPELHSFLNTVTGDVIRIFDGTENAEIRLRQAEGSSDYLYIEPISSREQYRWMEEFIELVEDPTLKDKLNIAIDGKGAFRRFKDVLVGYPAERERWFGKRAEKLRAHISNWLTEKKIEATNAPPWEGGATSEPSEPRRSRDYDMDHRSWRDGANDLRMLAHEMVDLVPSRELPSAVTFLEFLRSRRGYRRGRYS